MQPTPPAQNEATPTSADLRVLSYLYVHDERPHSSAWVSKMVAIDPKSAKRVLARLFRNGWQVGGLITDAGRAHVPPLLRSSYAVKTLEEPWTTEHTGVGVRGLLVALHKGYDGDVDSSEVADILGISPQAAAKVLSRWEGKSLIFVRTGRSSWRLTDPTGDKSENYMADPDLAERIRQRGQRALDEAQMWRDGGDPAKRAAWEAQQFGPAYLAEQTLWAFGIDPEAPEEVDPTIPTIPTIPTMPAIPVASVNKRSSPDRQSGQEPQPGSALDHLRRRKQAMAAASGATIGLRTPAI